MSLLLYIKRACKRKPSKKSLKPQVHYQEYKYNQKNNQSTKMLTNKQFQVPGQLKHFDLVIGRI